MGGHPLDVYYILVNFQGEQSQRACVVSSLLLHASKAKKQLKKICRDKKQ